MVKRLLLVAVLACGALFAQKDSVPVEWQAPNGPYVQAPPDCGGKWFYVNPFNQRPWARFCTEQPSTSRPLPPGFEDIFGPEPTRKDGESYLEFVKRQSPYLQRLSTFRGAGIPADYPLAGNLAVASNSFKAFGISVPKCFQSRYDVNCYFKDEDFEFPAGIVLGFPHMAISTIQMSQLESGVVPAKIHPFVPPMLIPKDR